MTIPLLNVLQRQYRDSKTVEEMAITIRKSVQQEKLRAVYDRLQREAVKSIGDNPQGGLVAAQIAEMHDQRGHFGEESVRFGEEDFNGKLPDIIARQVMIIMHGTRLDTNSATDFDVGLGEAFAGIEVSQQQDANK